MRSGLTTAAAALTALPGTMLNVTLERPALLHFFSDAKITDAGFVAQYKSIPRVEAASDWGSSCSGVSDVLVLAHGEISDGSGDSLNYADDLSCAWILRGQSAPAHAVRPHPAKRQYTIGALVGLGAEHAADSQRRADL